MVDGIGSVGNSQSKPPIDPGILAQLQALGLKPQGSMKADLEAIQAAQAAQTTETTNTQSSIFETVLNKASGPKGGQGQKGGAPWGSIMDTLGIKGSGSATGDASNILAVLENMDPAKAASIVSQCNALGLAISLPEKTD